MAEDMGTEADGEASRDSGSAAPDGATPDSDVAHGQEIEREAWEVVVDALGVRGDPRTTGVVPEVQLYVLEALGDRKALERFAGACLSLGELNIARTALGCAGLLEGEDRIPEELLREKAKDALHRSNCAVAITLVRELLVGSGTEPDRSELLAEMRSVIGGDIAKVGRFGQLKQLIELFELLAGEALNECELELMGDKLLQGGEAGLALSLYEMVSREKEGVVKVEYNTGNSYSLLLPHFCERVGTALLEQKNYEKAAICFIAAGSRHSAEFAECVRTFEEAIVSSDITPPRAQYYYDLAVRCLNADGKAPDEAWHRDLASRTVNRVDVRIYVLRKGGLHEELCDLGDNLLGYYHEELDIVSVDEKSSSAGGRGTSHYYRARALLELVTACYMYSEDPERTINIADALLEAGEKISTIKALYDRADHKPGDPLFYWRLGVGHLQGIFDSNAGGQEDRVKRIQEACAAFTKCIELGGNEKNIKAAEYDRRLDESRHHGLRPLPRVRVPSAPNA